MDAARRSFGFARGHGQKLDLQVHVQPRRYLQRDTSGLETGGGGGEDAYRSGGVEHADACPQRRLFDVEPSGCKRVRSGSGPQVALSCSSYLQKSTPTFFILTVTEAEPPSGSEPKSTLEGTRWKPLGGAWRPLRDVNRQLLLTGPSTARNWERPHGSGGIQVEAEASLSEGRATFRLGTERTLELRMLAGSLTLAFLGCPITSA